MQRRPRRRTLAVTPFIAVALCSGASAQVKWRLADAPEGDNFAQIGYLKPSDESATYQIKAALSAIFPAFGTSQAVWEGRITPGIDKNTAVKQEVDNKYIDAAFGGAVELGSTGFYTLVPTFSGRYDQDDVADTRGYSLKIDTSLVSKPLMLGGIYELTKGLDFEWIPRLGIFYDKTTSGPDGTHGSATAGYYQLTLNLYPSAISNRLSIDTFFQGTKDFASTGDRQKATTNYVTLGVSYFFFDPKATSGWKPKISYEWVNGTDPFNNVPKQRYQQIVFQVKFI